MDNQALERLKDILNKNDKIGVVVGSNHALDEMASALSLFLALQTAGKHVSIATPIDPLVAVSSLVGINKVRKELAGEGGDLVVSFPYSEGEIEKVSYTLENGFLNIIVKAGQRGLAFEEKDVAYKRLGGMPTVLFVVGTPRLADLGSLFNPDALKDVTLVNIDNKSDNQGFGDVVLVSPKYSSVSEQIMSILQSLGMDVDIDIAQNLLSGIAQATDNFQKPTTSFLAFENAAVLMKKGATRPKLSQRSTSTTEPDPFGASMPQGSGQRNQPRRDLSQDNNGRGNRQFPRQMMNQSRQAPMQSGQVQQPQQPRTQPQFQQPISRPSWQSSTSEFVSTSGAQDKDASLGKEKSAQDDLETPPDWLAPKVYKGSTNI